MITYQYTICCYAEQGRSSRKFTRFSTCLARGYDDIKQLGADATHFIINELGGGKEILVFDSRQGTIASVYKEEEEESD